MKKIIIFLLVLFTFKAFAQGLSGNVVLKNGKKIKFQTYVSPTELYKGKSTTYKELLNEFGGENYINNFDVVDSMPSGHFCWVYFRLFTNKPLFIITTDKGKIRSAIEKFNLNDYFNSYSFISDIKKMIKEKDLSDIFLLKTLGHPDRVSKVYQDSNDFEMWYYIYPEITLHLKNGIVIGYSKSSL